MRNILILSVFAIFSFANANPINMKQCEHIKLSPFTTLVSCHKLDYLVEYRLVDDEEKDTIKKITVITLKDQRIIKSAGK